MSRYSNEWHQRDHDATASVLDTDIYRGLDAAEVQRRRRREGKNKIWHVKHTSGTEYAMRNIGDLTGLVLLAAAVTSAVFERTALAVSVCVILFLGVALRVITYVKARHVLEKVSVEGVPSATVIRGGRTVVVRADDIVIGDIVLLEPGDIVPCDGRIVSDGELRVSERGITENKTSVIKRDTVILTDAAGVEVPCEYRVNMVFAGSAVLSGSCRIIATACGDDALVSMRRGGIVIPSGEELPVIEKLTENCRVGNLIMLVAVMLLVVLTVCVRLIRGGDFSFSEAFIDAMALAAASAFSYLVTSAYISATVPVRRASSVKEGRAVIKNAAELEKISRVSAIIASDVAVFKSGKADFSAYLSGDELKSAESGDKSAIEMLCHIMTVACVTDEKKAIAASGEAIGTEREVLLRRTASAAAVKLDFNAASPNCRYGDVLDHSVSATSRGDCDNIITYNGGTYEFHTCGDVRDILSYCDRYVKAGKVRALSEESRNKILRAAAQIEGRGGTVIAVAHRDSPYTSLKRLSVLTTSMCFDGFIAAEEESAAETDSYAEKFKNGDISLVLLSPRPDIDRGYLKKIGLVGEKIPIISCRDVIENKELPNGSFIVSVPPRSENREKIDAAAKVRLATVRRLGEAIEGAAVVTGEPAEAGMLSEKTVGIAVSKGPDRPIPQTLKRRAEVSVYPNAGAGYGGFVGTLRAVTAAVSCLENLRHGVLFAMTSQAARLICTVLSIIVGLPAMNASSILLLGMIFDFLAVLVISFAPDEYSFTRREKREAGLPDRLSVMKASACGAAIGALCFAVCAAAAHFAGDRGTLVPALTSALILSQLVLVSEFLLDGGLLSRSGEVNTAYIFYALLSLVCVLLFAFANGFCSFFGGDAPSAVTVTASALCAPVMLAFFEITKKIKNGK